MALAEQYAQFVLLQESETLSNREYAKRIGVSEGSIRYWLKGNIPEGGDDALKYARGIRAGQLAATAHIEQQAAKRLHDPEVREAFDKILTDWCRTWPQFALSLPVERMRQLKRLGEVIQETRTAGEERLENLRTEIAAIKVYLAESRDEERHLQARGLPNLIRTLAALFLDVESESDENVITLEW